MFLDKIVAQTLKTLEQRKQEYPLGTIKRLASEQTPPRDLLRAFEPRTQVHLIAEVKRASPSKGMLAPHIDPVALARTYEANGAAAISVLTEPDFFLGSPAYLTAIKQAVNIPVLRKDFIVDEYQVHEARAWGADAILLICAILDDNQLYHLLQTAHELGMRCLVETHSREEAQRAVAAGAMIIGVNSRDLVTFEMNPYLIRDIRRLIPSNRVVIAESGIHTTADTRRLARYDVQAMLVGESLVVSDDVPAQMHMLLSGARQSTQVKICGLSRPADIDAAVEAGADMLGFIFHEPSHRYVKPEQVQGLLAASELYQHLPKGQTRPDLVGVFVNKDAAFINETAEQAGLHFVQLHGTETPEFCQQIQKPVLKALHLRESADLVRLRDYQDVAWRLLLDTPTPEWGGTGVTHDWELARTAAQMERIILAGGLTVDNVAQAINSVQPWGVDVSSGVETQKQKDPAKIRAFIEQVRAREN
ncbi:bifunctional indole-3-glycerol phosphate synthase/phosphoribosylanthranilate isomerase [Reticulibacter mediterranei]|uniref:Multifunctional fusion protein n=1 Tax=Reticulibacter mediterranei TaxID=2778369 RepID=A0A8J3N335_9CHLR|nr:bifunctional indole-3-glycerol-phosphate synthase TrpC/phosphoribosylanthranilate isomerase TrpF [Reticulibacter mediterranei]GHO96714.1 bifunctional indole-3-glycerol phosphate synthase/phosphoribosylanthranilate isomerase [Reticulibacter mediterranei]